MGLKLLRRIKVTPIHVSEAKKAYQEAHHKAFIKERGRLGEEKGKHEAGQPSRKLRTLKILGRGAKATGKGILTVRKYMNQPAPRQRVRYRTTRKRRAQPRRRRQQSQEQFLF